MKRMRSFPIRRSVRTMTSSALPAMIRMDSVDSRVLPDSVALMTFSLPSSVEEQVDSVALQEPAVAHRREMTVSCE